MFPGRILSIKGVGLVGLVDSVMPTRQPRLASYFDAPASSWHDEVECSYTPAVATLEGFEVHDGKKVFVPKGEKYENIPDGKKYFEKGSKVPFDESYWGHNPKKLAKANDHKAKVAQWKEWRAHNKAVLLDNKNPGQNTTYHVPGQRWRPSDHDYNGGKATEGKTKHEGKVARIESLKKLISNTQADAWKSLDKHKNSFRGEGEANLIANLMGIQGALDRHKEEKHKILGQADVKRVPGDDTATKKAKRLLGEKLLHEHTITVPGIASVIENMKEVKIFTEKRAGLKCFSGTSVPPSLSSTTYEMYSTVWHAINSTVKHQALVSLTKVHATDTDKTSGFVKKSMEAEGYVKELHALTPKKRRKGKKSKPRTGQDGRPLPAKKQFADHETLIKWYNEHRPRT